MKTIRTKFFALLLLAAFACSEKDDSTAVANDEAAEMISTSISSGSGGLTGVIDDATVNTKTNAGGRTNACGYSESKDVTKTSAANASVTYNFSMHYDYALTCTAFVPTSMTANVTYSGSVDAPRMATQSSGTGSLTVKTLDASYTYFTINGTYTRTGSFTSKIRNKNSSNSVLTITLTDVAVDKSTRAITGGSASITVTGTATGKGDFNYSANLVFKGNKQGELTVNNVKYSINLETGDVTPL